jgi:hypothetical protein
MAFSYRTNHPAGSPGWQFDSDSGDAYTYEFATHKITTNGVTDGQSCAIKTAFRSRSSMPGKPCRSSLAIRNDEKGNFLTHPSPASVVGVTTLAGPSFRPRSRF